MISVTQGPSINASLASLDYDKKFEAGAEGIRVKAKAEEAKGAEIKTAFKDMTDKLEKAQITASKVAAAIEQNPMLFEGLDVGDDLASKSFQKFMKGDYSPQTVNNLNAYIDAANTQQQRDIQTQMLRDQQKEKRIAAEVNKYIGQTLNNSVDYARANEVDMSSDIIVNQGYDVMQTIQDPDVKAAYNTALFDISNKATSLPGADTADIKNFKFTVEQYQKVRSLIQQGRMDEAKEILRGMGVELEYKDRIGTIVDVTDAVLRKRFGPADPESGKENLEDDDIESPVGGESIGYKVKGIEVNTKGKYNSGDVSEPKKSSRGKVQRITKVSKSTFETYTREAQEKYLNAIGEKFTKEKEGEESSEDDVISKADSIVG
ncbi:hypothetical protein LFDSGCCC_CDS0002 [Phage C75C1]|nr:hypothetical protein LFDSGCCC_CDS0002 [Phage C75C1]